MLTDFASFNRSWRWHIQLRQWMQKDESMPTRRVNQKQEHGVYWFWDHTTWSKSKREFVLDYEHLDLRHANGMGGTPSL